MEPQSATQVQAIWFSQGTEHSSYVVEGPAPCRHDTYITHNGWHTPATKGRTKRKTETNSHAAVGPHVEGGELVQIVQDVGRGAPPHAEVAGRPAGPPGGVSVLLARRRQSEGGKEHGDDEGQCRPNQATGIVMVVAERHCAAESEGTYEGRVRGAFPAARRHEFLGWAVYGTPCESAKVGHKSSN